MLLINNKKHTIKYNGVLMNYSYNSYTIFEYCDVIKEKEEVKHPTRKKEILYKYGLN